MPEEKKQIDVTLIQSIALAVRDIDNEVRHIQLSIVQEVESKKFRCYFDVVDPSQVKLSEE